MQSGKIGDRMRREAEMYVYTKQGDSVKWSAIKNEQRLFPIPCAVCKKTIGYLMASANQMAPQIPICFCSQACINEIFTESQQVTLYSVRKAGKAGNKKRNTGGHNGDTVSL